MFEATVLGIKNEKELVSSNMLLINELLRTKRSPFGSFKSNMFPIYKSLNVRL